MNPVEFIIKLILTSLLGYLLGYLYINFGKSFSNRLDLSYIFPMLSIVTMLIITVVKSSLALSLGLVGALSIVRFRTPIKEPEELNYLFLSIALGISIGADQYVAAILTFMFISIFIFLRSKFSNRLEKVSKGTFTAIIGFTNNISEEQIIKIISDLTINPKVKRLTKTNNDELEISLSFMVKDLSTISKIKTRLNDLSSHLFIDIIDSSNIIGSS